MKKNDQDKIKFNFNVSTNKSLEIDKIKTTNINILLNRVKSNKKRAVKKRILFISVIVFLISSLTFYLNF